MTTLWLREREKNRRLKQTLQGGASTPMGDMVPHDMTLGAQDVPMPPPEMVQGDMHLQMKDQMEDQGDKAHQYGYGSYHKYKEDKNIKKRNMHYVHKNFYPSMTMNITAHKGAQGQEPFGRRWLWGDTEQPTEVSVQERYDDEDYRSPSGTRSRSRSPSRRRTSGRRSMGSRSRSPTRSRRFEEYRNRMNSNTRDGRDERNDTHRGYRRERYENEYRGGHRPDCPIKDHPGIVCQCHCDMKHRDEGHGYNYGYDMYLHDKDPLLTPENAPSWWDTMAANAATRNMNAANGGLAAANAARPMQRILQEHQTMDAKMKAIQSRLDAMEPVVKKMEENYS